jgi:hypothetical protein
MLESFMNIVFRFGFIFTPYLLFSLSLFRSFKYFKIYLLYISKIKMNFNNLIGFYQHKLLQFIKLSVDNKDLQKLIPTNNYLNLFCLLKS